jgi:hypothetical protein
MTEPIHLHLLVNHVPVIGVPFVVVLLVIALIRGTDEGARLSLWASVVAALLTIPVYLTGEPAERALRPWDAARTLRPLMHEHEDAARWALIACLLFGAVAAGFLVLDRRRPIRRSSLVVLLVVGLFASAVLARASLLGGYIRHPEIHGGTPPVAPAAPPATPPAG